MRERRRGQGANSRGLKKGGASVPSEAADQTDLGPSERLDYQRVLSDVSWLNLELEAADLDRKALRSELDRFKRELDRSKVEYQALQTQVDRAFEERRAIENRLDLCVQREVDLLQALDVTRKRAREGAFQVRLRAYGLDDAPSRRRVGDTIRSAVNLRLARRAARRRDWAAAERRYARILLIDPGRAHILVQYGHSLKEQGELELASVAYAQAYEELGSDPSVVQHLAHALRAIGSNSEANAVLGKTPAASVYATDLPAPAQRQTAPPLALRYWFGLAAARRSARARQWATAVSRYQSLLRFFPGVARLWIQLGHALKEGGRLEDALVAYANAIRLDATQAEAHLQIGHAFKLLNRSSEAEIAYVHAYQLAASSNAVKDEMDVYNKSRGELIDLVLGAGIRPRIQKRISLRDLPALMLARGAARRGDWASASKRYKGLLSRNPGHWPLWLQSGHALKEGGDLEGAVSAYLHALAIKPDESDSHLQLGHALKLCGDLDEAARVYRRAYELNPAFRAARRELETLVGAGSPMPSQSVQASARGRQGVTNESKANDGRVVGGGEIHGLSRREAAIWRQLKSALSDPKRA